ncbi:MAG: S41 family peptidase [Muribaculaceae bacterium]|nr:S41 family peptidase [Muribaculaceae bacterium]
MKLQKVLLIILATFTLQLYGQNNSLSQTENLEDFEFAINELESSYAGFDDFVNDSTRQGYNQLVQKLRTQIEKGTPGWEAVLQLYSWFDDGHLGLALPYQIQAKYLSPARLYKPYTEIETYAPELVAHEVSDRTYLIRIPAFDEDVVTVEWVDSVINLLSNRNYQNLIIDLRGNEGGDERLWHPFLSLLYDHNGSTKSAEFRNSPQNINFMQSIAEDVPEAQMILDKFAKNPTQPYILLSDSEDIPIEVTPIRSTIENIIYIIDANVASASEEFLIQSKAISNRVHIYGKENTSGTLDYASVREAELPNSGIIIAIPMGRSCRLPNNGIDKTGIAPDFKLTIGYPTILTDNIDEWVEWITNQLEK